MSAPADCGDVRVASDIGAESLSTLNSFLIAGSAGGTFNEGRRGRLIPGLSQASLSTLE
jgi:hypothetical protein